MDSVARVRRPTYLVRCVRAQLRPLDISLDVVEQVLSRYGLRLLQVPRNVSVGQRSRNVVLCTSHGKMVLKRYRKSWAWCDGHLWSLDCDAPVAGRGTRHSPSQITDWRNIRAT